MLIKHKRASDIRSSEITPESAERLALQPGVRVIASWKATSTRILATG